MKKHGFGVLFALTLVIGLGTLFQDFRFDQLLDHERDTAIALDRQHSAVEVALADLRTAEAGYVATGQDSSIWMTRASDLFNQVDTALGALKSATAETEASGHYETAQIALKDLKSIDARARSDVNGDHKYEASDRLFTDTREANERIAAELGDARASLQLASASRVARVSRMRLGMNGVAMIFALAVALFFWRARRPEAVVPVAIPDVQPARGSELSLKLNAEIGPLAPVRTAEPPPPPPRAVNLGDAAELCVDLARVIDSRDVPALLARAAGVLGAKGVILWMSDSGGALLRPSLAHGYSDRVLMKMGVLQVDGDNATSLAFRSLRGQSVNGAASSQPGAIAVPLVTPTGCVGVLAAEVNRQRPSPDTVEMARIIAAQLATLVAPAGDSARAAQG
jgi:hypothetical protein